MPKMPDFIGRLFRRTNSAVIGRIHTHAINQPLLVHPRIGAQLLTAYLHGGAADLGDDAEASVPLASPAGNVAVINISGPLVHRPMPDLCGNGPLSYEAIRCVFDDAIADSNVSAIVFRMDSCGGMVSGCFDLTDHIFANRGKKPIVAQVDDTAYSAGYAIASACDSIQVSRTSGIGSIGVFTFHIDRSGQDQQNGLKYTFVYSGDHKLDGNPHEALPESVRNALQKHVDETRELFASSVARYRSMSIDDVLATEADDFTGAAGVSAGLADSVGTLSDLLSRINAPAEPAAPIQATIDEEEEMPDANSQNSAATAPAVATEQPAAPVVAAEPAAENARAAAQSAMVTALAASDLRPDLKAALISASGKADAPGIPVDQVAARVAHAKSVADLCAAAKLDSYAADFVAANTSIETVRKQLADAVASPPATEISAHHATVPAAAAQPAKSSIQATYERRRDAATGRKA